MSDQTPTHINAFKADLADAEKELVQAQGKVDGLKETIATMEAGTAETPINDQAEADRVAAEEDEAKALEEAGADEEQIAADDAAEEADEADAPADGQAVPSEPVAPGTTGEDPAPASSEVDSGHVAGDSAPADAPADPAAAPSEPTPSV